MNDDMNTGAASLGRTHVVVGVGLEAAALSALRRALFDEPCELLTTPRPERALGWLSEWDVSLIISGARPPAGFDELAQAARARTPAPKMLSLGEGAPEEASLRRTVRALLAGREREDEQVMIDLAASGWSPIRPAAAGSAMATETATQTLEKVEPPSAPAVRPIVVAVDDEPSILAALKRVLRREPVELRTTQEPEEALRWLREENVGLIIADQRMPEMSGIDLLAEAGRESPETARMLLTGYPDPELLKACDQTGARRLITKPWDDDHLRRAVRDLLRRREAS